MEAQRKIDEKKSNEDSAKKDKRNRGDNWTSEEKRELLELIVPYGNIIGKKKVEANKNKQNKSAWQDDFFAKFGNKRSST